MCNTKHGKYNGFQIPMKNLYLTKAHFNIKMLSSKNNPRTTSAQQWLSTVIILCMTIGMKKLKLQLFKSKNTYLTIYCDFNYKSQ